MGIQAYSILLIALALWCGIICDAWVSSFVPSIQSRSCTRKRHAATFQSTAAVADEVSAEEDEDDEEYEYVEYDMLTESEFLGSEWLVGTVANNGENIKETWVRLATDKDGKNVAIWGDNSQGKWNFDVANQFLSMSKENFFGKNIWAGVVDDYYYLQGTVRGWSFISPAAVNGQWQARRLGVDPDEAGTPPWFENETSTDASSSASD